MGEAQPKPEPSDDVAAQIKSARIKRDMLYMGEPIAFGSDADCIDALCLALERLAKERDEADGWRIRYGEVVAKHAELEAALAKAQAAVPTYAQIKAVVFECSERMKTSGESHPMFARWVSEGLHRLTAAPPTPSDGLRKALENVDKAITSARNYIPDDDESVASDIFAYYLNAAQMEVRAALAEQEKAND